MVVDFLNGVEPSFAISCFFMGCLAIETPRLASVDPARDAADHCAMAKDRRALASRVSTMRPATSTPLSSWACAK